MEKWKFQGNQGLKSSAVSVRGVFNVLMQSISKEKEVVHLCRVDPTDNPLFSADPVAAHAVSTAAHSGNFNGYPPTFGLPQARRAIAEYLSRDLPNKLSAEDVYVTVGATQAIEIILPSVFATPGANILLPRPGFPQYETRAALCGLEVRHFDLLPNSSWEVDIDSLEALADDKTMAMVLISPSNPCGNVFTYQHLKRVAETARKLGIFVISDEVYAHIAFGSNPFVPMGVFSSIVPVITLGSISKRWILPGWRFGWIATCDPHGIFQKTGIAANIERNMEITSDPPTFMQVQINLSQIEGIADDVDFCVKLAKEESLLILPGVIVGLKNWLRVSFGLERSAIEEGLSRLKAFCLRHAKMSQQISNKWKLDFIYFSLAVFFTSKEVITGNVCSQAAIPEILERTNDEFYSKNLDITREAANALYERFKEIPSLICPHKPDGAMAVMVQINLSQIEGIADDVDFCVKLAKEESLLILPGVIVGLKNWLRVSFGLERSAIEEGLNRLKAFCLRHAKMSQQISA
ncbi:probable aminotransferase TAT2 isoform X2 [Arachis hypogaea]|uniref:probable aminotransferase TAT2 isoform X2 n=1 Tax=Arachis hypogaea TaxID=3818 RepID=UPI003B219329